MEGQKEITGLKQYPGWLHDGATSEGTISRDLEELLYPWGKSRHQECSFGQN
jgi:hypothetical protein